MQSCMIMDFDIKGNLTPYEIISINVSEFYNFFVKPFDESDTRNELFNNYTKYIEDFVILLKINDFYQYIDGSYTTKKLNPNDIDLVNFVNVSDFNSIKESERLKAIKNLFTQYHSSTGKVIKGKSKETYKIDSYLIPVYDEADPRYDLTLNYINYWKKWLGFDRQNNPKGIIKITVDQNSLRNISELNNDD